MRSHLFGTDGIRGTALRPPLDLWTLSRLGAALTVYLEDRGLPLRVLMAGDTRASTLVLASWVGGAFRAAGGELVWGGVLPTPALSHIIRDDGGFGAGIVVSASHNPSPDNGIKLVSSVGTKWPVRAERELEAHLQDIGDAPPVTALGEVDGTLSWRYLDLLGRTLPPAPLAGLRLIVDAANGAASRLAEELFSRLGATVWVINGKPDGTNINANCGALHPERLADLVTSKGADAGVALDGDADRAILVTHRGRVLDGDDALLVWSRFLALEGTLNGHAVVATVMSNLGLELALRHDGVRLVRCPVGDREVWQAMNREHAVLGGEQSGHVICAHHSVTGDGLLTAAHLLAVVRTSGRPLEELANLERCPQVLRNVRVARRRSLDEVPELTGIIAAVEGRLGEEGRVLVRFSGTEPLLRVMVEASDATAARDAVEELVAATRRYLGESEVESGVE